MGALLLFELSVKRQVFLIESLKDEALERQSDLIVYF